MPSVGERLRADREAAGISIDDMAGATGIGRDFLDALERDDIRKLPGKAFGKLYIRAYAEVLGFDPRTWIEDYDRERRLDPEEAEPPASQEPDRPRAVSEALAAWRASKMKDRGDALDDTQAPDPTLEALDEPVAEVIEEPELERSTEPAAAPPLEPGPEPVPALGRPSWGLPAAFVVIGVIVVGGGFFLLRGSRTRAPEALPATVAASTAPNPPSPPANLAPSPIPTPVPSPSTKPAPPSKERAHPITSEEGRSLTVTESGLGRRLQNRRVVDEGDHFPPSTRVIFQTRILGGASGDVVRHVWIFDGKVEQSISLRLGGSDWRTHSSKTIGKAGDWTVEARDASGRVLARAAFTCASPAP